MNKLWKKYDIMTEQCYLQMANGTSDIQVWKEAFRIMLQAIEAEREENPDFGKEFCEIDDDLEYSLDVTGWLEDYLDELDMHELYDELISDCEKIIGIFAWKEDSPSELKFRIASALGAQRKNEEALQFCEEWYQEEKDNIVAATATIYARMGIKDIDGAIHIIDRFIGKDTICSEENDIIFAAAEMVYELSGDKAAQKKIQKSLQEYEEKLEQFMLGMGADEDDDFDWEDEDLPF